MTKSVAYLFKYNFYVDVETNANRHRFQPLPPLILVIPPTAFVLPLPGRDVYSPPLLQIWIIISSTGHEHKYHPACDNRIHSCVTPVTACDTRIHYYVTSVTLLFTHMSHMWHSYSLLYHTCDTRIHSYVTPVTLVFNYMSHLWHSYSLICHTCDARIHSYVTPVTLVFTHMSHLSVTLVFTPRLCHHSYSLLDYVTPVTLVFTPMSHLWPMSEYKMVFNN